MVEIFRCRWGMSAAEPVHRPSKHPAESGRQKRKIPPKRRGQTDDATAWRFKFNRGEAAGQTVSGQQDSGRQTRGISSISRVSLQRRCLPARSASEWIPQSRLLEFTRSRFVLVRNPEFLSGLFLSGAADACVFVRRFVDRFAFENSRSGRDGNQDWFVVVSVRLGLVGDWGG